MATLLDALDQADKAVVRRAVEELVALAAVEARVAGLLAQRLRAAPRWPLAYALGQIARPSASCLEVLERGLGNLDPDLRWATQRLLADLGTRYTEVKVRLKDLLRHGTPTQRRMAVYCLRDIGSAGAGVPAGLLQAIEDPEPLVRVAVVTALAKESELGADVRTALEQAAANDPDTRVRNAAAFAAKRSPAGRRPSRSGPGPSKV